MIVRKMGRMTAAIGLAFLSSAGVASAFSNNLVNEGTYKGNTEVNEPVKLEVVAKDGKRMVDKIVIDQTSTDCGKTVLKDNDVIKKGAFVVKDDGFVVGGTWTVEDGIQGAIKGDCKGSDPAGKNNRFIATRVK